MQLLKLILTSTLLFSNPITVVPRTILLRDEAKPDFSGVWNARIIRSVDDNTPIRGLKIHYQAPKLKISTILRYRNPATVLGSVLASKSTDDFVYYTDGRGETNRSRFENRYNSPTKSKTERKGNTVVTTYSSSSKESGQKITTDSRVVLEVLSEGRKLKVTTTIVTEGVMNRVVQLYDRIDGTKATDMNGDWTQKVSNSVVSLMIEHRDPEIKVTRRVISLSQDETETSTYYTDGRGETNFRDGTSFKSITKWQESSLVFAVSSTRRAIGDKFNTSLLIKWQLDKDLKSLIESTNNKITSSSGIVIPPARETRLVYAYSPTKFPDLTN